MSSEYNALTALATIVEGTSGFSSANVSVGNWTILSSGRSSHYAIIIPSEAQRSGSTLSTKMNIYRANVDIWQRNGNDALSNLLDHCAEVVERVDSFRTLGLNDVLDANVVGMSEVFEAEYGGATWLRRSVRVEWMDNQEITYA